MILGALLQQAIFLWFLHHFDQIALHLSSYGQRQVKLWNNVQKIGQKVFRLYADQLRAFDASYPLRLVVTLKSET